MADFSFGFWNYPAASSTALSSVEDWAELGMNLTLSPNYDANCTKQHFLALLDKAHEHNIRLILNDPRATWHRLTNVGEAAYREGFLAMLADFGHHPAVWGYHVGDEPHTPTLDDALRACAIGKELAPDLKAFLNLLPWRDCYEGDIGFSHFPDYLDAVAQRGRIDFYCYDCYSQMDPGQSGWPMYFRSLRYFGEASARNNIPFWTTLLSIGHFRYRVPSLDDFRWQLSTAAACGATGVFWFFLYYNEPSQSNYRRAPITFGRKTSAYEDLWEAQLTFKNHIADKLAGLKLEKVQFTKEAFGGFPQFSGDDVISPPRGKDYLEYENALIFSYFRDVAGRLYVMVVNNSCTESIHETLYLTGENRRVFICGNGGVEHELPTRIHRHDNGWFESNDGGNTTLRQWFAPGQSILFRME